VRFNQVRFNDATTSERRGNQPTRCSRASLARLVGTSAKALRPGCCFDRDS
jgi:hypothetical protein